MKLEFHNYALALRHTFTISRGSQDSVPVLIVSLEHDGIVGWGETSPSRFYGQSIDTVRQALESIVPWLETQDLMEFRTVLEEAAVRLGPHTQALCALDLAVHDWVGKRLNLPVYQLLGLSPKNLPATSYTIGIDAIPKMIEKLREFSSFPIFKIKLGTDHDVEIVRELRQVTGAVLRVDANCAWSVDETISNSRALKDLCVEFIEQPLPPDRLGEMERLHKESALPLMADENSVTPQDVPGLAGRFHAVNIKLVKCGGLQPAIKMIAMARALGMKIMLGCMIESSNACTAAAHLGPLVDYLDLDGPLLIGNDPFEGMKIENGKITLPKEPGLGVKLFGPLV